MVLYVEMSGNFEVTLTKAPSMENTDHDDEFLHIKNLKAENSS